MTASSNDHAASTRNCTGACHRDAIRHMLTTAFSAPIDGFRSCPPSDRCHSPSWPGAHRRPGTTSAPSEKRQGPPGCPSRTSWSGIPPLPTLLGSRRPFVSRMLKGKGWNGCVGSWRLVDKTLFGRGCGRETSFRIDSEKCVPGGKGWVTLGLFWERLPVVGRALATLHDLKIFPPQDATQPQETVSNRRIWSR